MIDLTDEQKALFYTGGNSKDYIFNFPDIGLKITNDTIHQEAVTIKESIVETEDFTLGGCIASSIEFEVSEIIQQDLNGLQFDAELYVNLREDGTYDLKMPMGTYRVDSAKMVDDKDYKKVMAYDALYDASVDISEWWNGYFSSKSHTIKETREALLSYLNIPFVVQNLPNDGMTINKEKEYSKGTLTGIDVLRSMCVISGGFGRINREGKFEVLAMSDFALFPEETLYPEEILYPEDKFLYIGISEENENAPEYITTRYEEYITKKITCLFVQTESQLVKFGEDETNPYIISGNFLLYGKSENELKAIGQSIFGVVKDKAYRPNTTTLTGLPYMEVGDVFGLVKRNDTIESYIFSRTLAGVQGLRDTYEAKGSELRTNELSLYDEIDNIKEDIENVEDYVDDVSDKLDEVSEDLDEFKSETSVKFEVTEDRILSTVATSSYVWDLTKSYRNQDYSNVYMLHGYGEPSPDLIDTDADMSLYYLDEQTGVIYISRSLGSSRFWQNWDKLDLISQTLASRIEQTDEAITLEATRATAKEGELAGRITVTADAITSEVTRAQGAENNLSSTITQTANNINLKVSKGDVVSEINQSSDTISLTAGRLLITTGNFILNAAGQATAYNLIARNAISLIGTDGKEVYITALFGDGLKINDSIRSTGDILASGDMSCSDMTAWGDISAAGSIYCSGSADLGSLDITGTTYLNGTVYANGVRNRTSTGTANVRCQNTSNALAISAESSKRFKHDIKDICEGYLQPEKLYNLPVRQYIYNKDYLIPQDQRYNKIVCGFIAEDVEKHYPIAVEYNDLGQVQNWNERYIIPPMLELIKRQKQQLDEQDRQLFALQGELSIIKQSLAEGGVSTW